MPEMISTGLTRYAGRDLKPGDKFSVEDAAHVRTLSLSRKARLAEAEPQSYATRALTAASAATSSLRSRAAKKTDA